MQRLAIVAFVFIASFVLIAATARDADAQVEVPRGSVGLIGQIAQNTGAAGDAYRFGWLVGVSSTYQVGRVGNVGFGPAWSLAIGEYILADENLADERVTNLEMSLGMRVRRMLGKTTPRFFFVNAGATILRLDRAVPPENERLYIGPYASIGLDQYLSKGAMVSFAVRYGLIGTGPASLGVRLGISLGT